MSPAIFKRWNAHSAKELRLLFAHWLPDEHKSSPNLVKADIIAKLFAVDKCPTRIADALAEPAPGDADGDGAEGDGDVNEGDEDDGDDHNDGSDQDGEDEKAVERKKPTLKTVAPKAMRPTSPFSFIPPPSVHRVQVSQ